MSDAPRRQERAVSKLMPTALRCDDMTRCTECDFDYESANGEDFARLAGPFVDSYVELLRSNNLARLQLRPSPHGWSPLEYA